MRFRARAASLAWTYRSGGSRALLAPLPRGGVSGLCLPGVRAPREAVFRDLLQRIQAEEELGSYYGYPALVASLGEARAPEGHNT